jgi:hypothetical protein
MQGDGVQDFYPNGNPMFIDSDRIVIYDIVSLKEVLRQAINTETKILINQDYELNYQSKN